LIALFAPAVARAQEANSLGFGRLISDFQSGDPKLVAAARKHLVDRGLPLLQELQKRKLDQTKEFSGLLDEVMTSAKQKAKVYAIGVYETEDDKREVVVRISKMKNPFYLVVTAYTTVEWNVQIDDDSKVFLLHTIIGGYQKQKFLNPKLPASTYTYEDNKTKTKDLQIHFHAHEYDESHFPDMQAKLKKLIGKNQIVLQGRSFYHKLPFEITED
jgi:predicted nucleic acid-binding Zn ribbon protein